MTELTVSPVAPGEHLASVGYQSGVFFSTTETYNFGTTRETNLLWFIDPHRISFDLSQLPVPVLAPRVEMAFRVKCKSESAPTLDTDYIRKPFDFLRQVLLLPITMSKCALLTFTPSINISSLS